jgi:protein involved in polysaccharide export with SLBB domain
MSRRKEKPAKLRRRAMVHFSIAACLLAAGCVSNPNRANIEKNLLQRRAGAAHHEEIVGKYTAACPDVLQVHVDGRSQPGGVYTVGPDGRLSFGPYGSVRVEGKTLPEIAQAVAHAVDARPEHVNVRVAQFTSRHLILIGEVVGRHRIVPYQGPETVLDVLQRVGGITPGAEPTEVYVLRSHIAGLQRPEVFHVDLQAIVLDRKHETNICVEPYDQIYVGETRQARIEKCIPPWLRPTYQKVWDMLPTGKTPQEGQHSFTDWIRGLVPFEIPRTDPQRNGEPQSRTEERKE